jgi:hypothetical protein
VTYQLFNLAGPLCADGSVDKVEKVETRERRQLEAAAAVAVSVADGGLRRQKHGHELLGHCCRIFWDNET